MLPSLLVLQLPLQAQGTGRAELSSPSDHPLLTETL